MEQTLTTIQQQALALHANGYSIFPCNLDKTPALKEWKPYQTAQASEEKVLEWFSIPNRTIAIATGKLSGIIVIDIDTYKGAKDIFPETFTVQTGNGGLQKYYQYTEGFTISASGYPSMPFVDLRSDGGYVIASGSITDYIDKQGKKAGGEYKVINNIPIAPFPIHLFPKQKQRKTITELTTAKAGARNATLASFAGKLLQAEPNENNWYTEILPAVQRANMTYTPTLPDSEVLTVFNSIAKKEKQRRISLTEETPVIIDDIHTGETMAIKKSRSGIPFMNMSNVVAILEAHPDFRDKIRYNLFRQEIEIDGVPIEDNDIIKIQYTLQTKFGLHAITKDAVFSALVHCAYDNRYDEAKDWLTDLKWDGQQRLFTWLTTATGVEDNDYNRGVGAQWFIQIADRIMNPGCIADYMLVLVGGQGIGKTSLFRIIGGKWYKSFSGSVENKDFYLSLRGALIIDLDEGATLYKAEVLKLKTMITQRDDEFRAPYDRVPKKFPRRFIFSMSTNNIEPFVDATGNRRYWAVDLPQTMVNFKWLEDNREQLFAEALHWLKYKDNPDMVPQVPKDEAERIQQDHLPDDSWAELIINEVRKNADYCEGSENFSTTVIEVFTGIFTNEHVLRLDRKHEMRIANIFRNQLGLEKIRKMVDGEQKNRWYISEKKQKELKDNPSKKVIPALEELVDLLKNNNQEEIPF